MPETRLVISEFRQAHLLQSSPGLICDVGNSEMILNHTYVLSTYLHFLFFLSFLPFFFFFFFFFCLFRTTPPTAYGSSFSLRPLKIIFQIGITQWHNLNSLTVFFCHNIKADIYVYFVYSSSSITKNSLTL